MSQVNITVAYLIERASGRIGFDALLFFGDARMSLSAQFSVIPREVFDDKRLDYRAKGLLCVLITRSDEWKGSITNLVEFVTPRDKDGNIIRELKGEGKAAIRCSIQKLEKLGYLRRIPQHDEKGMFSGYEYHLMIPPVPVAVPQQGTPSSD